MVWINQNHSFQQQPGGFKPITPECILWDLAGRSSLGQLSHGKRLRITNDLTWRVIRKEKQLKKKVFYQSIEAKIFIIFGIWSMADGLIFCISIVWTQFQRKNKEPQFSRGQEHKVCNFSPTSTPKAGASVDYGLLLFSCKKQNPPPLS